MIRLASCVCNRRLKVANVLDSPIAAGNSLQMVGTEGMSTEISSAVSSHKKQDALKFQQISESGQYSGNVNLIYLQQGFLCQFLVNLRLVGDITCTECIIQRAQSFLIT